MTSISCKTFGSLLVAAAVTTACGGSTTGAGPTVQVSTPIPTAPVASQTTYVTLTDANSTATSPLAGSALVSNTATGTLNTAQTSGQLVRGNDTITLRDGQYVFTGDISPTGVSNDVQGSTLLVGVGLDDGYDFAATYSGSYAMGGVRYDTVGVVGIPTDLADVPTTGTATYAGTANLSVTTENTLSHTFSDGEATVQVNFGTGQATVVFENFTVTNHVGNVAIGPFDEMTISGMSIDGTAMSGGTVAFENAGQHVDITGANFENASQGTLFGYDSGIGAPDEVGGVVLVTGDTGNVSGAFIAD